MAQEEEEPSRLLRGLLKMVNLPFAFIVPTFVVTMMAIGYGIFRIVDYHWLLDFSR
jgi:hypothetical protein